MKAGRVVGIMKLCGFVAMLGALPASILSIWGHQIFVDVYGETSMSFFLLLPIGFVGAVCAILCAIILLITRKKRDLKIFLYFLAMLFLIPAPAILLRDLVSLGMNWRIHHEALFAECKKNAQEVEGHGYFNVCESNDMSGMVGSAQVFRDVIYDSSDTKIFFSPLRPKISGALSSYAYSDKMTAEHITDHYYFVYGSLEYEPR